VSWDVKKLEGGEAGWVMVWYGMVWYGWLVGWLVGWWKGKDRWESVVGGYVWLVGWLVGWWNEMSDFSS